MAVPANGAGEFALIQMVDFNITETSLIDGSERMPHLLPLMEQY